MAEIKLYTLRNKNGMAAKVADYGAIITSLMVPDKNGRFDDVVLGYENVEDYKKNNPHFGAVVGRYGNRIAGGKFTLEGKTYTLVQNGGTSCLHGGIKGFDKAFWDVEQNSEQIITLKYTSCDAEEGFPGRLDVQVVYRLEDDDRLVIDYQAVTDKTTVCNLTQHSYFNLKGQGQGDILDHIVIINADKFTPVDENMIPTGQLWPVKDTPLDFTTPKAVGERINDDYPQLKLGRGYDHNWVLDKKEPSQLSLAAVVYEKTTGREMEVWTTEPGLQFYTGNILDGTDAGKGGKVYGRRYGLCLETQHWPDSPNKENFPSTVLRPGEVYKTETVYKFKVS